MRITGEGIFGPPRDHDEAIRVLRRAGELDVNFIDTADSYGPNVSEELIAEALYPYPPGLVIATKGGLVRPGPGQWPADGRPQHLREALEGSLRRLRVGRIDLYQWHRPDPNVPFEESLGAIAEFRREGKVRHVGLSNVTVEQLHAAQKIVPIVSVQNRYNVNDRSSEDLLQACEREGIAFIPWAPVGGVTLVQRREIDRLAEKYHATAAQINLAWLLQHSPVMLPIPGTSKVKHLEENVAAAAIRVEPNDVKTLERA